MLDNALIPKSFWNRKEGPFGMILVSLTLFSIGWGIMTLLPMLIQILENTLYTGIFAVSLALFFGIVTNGRVQALVWYAFRSFTRMIASIFTTVDPIGIVYNYIADLKESRKEMAEHIGELQKHMRKLKGSIQGNISEINRSLQRANIAKKANNMGQFQLSTRKAGRRDKSKRTLEELYTRMEFLLRVLEKMYQNSGYRIEDIEDEVDTKVAEFEASKGAQSAISSAMSILSGETDKEEIFEMAMDHMADEVNEMLGELDNLMYVSESVNDSIDLDNGIYENSGFAMLEEWEKKADSIFVTEGDMQTLNRLSQDEGSVLDLDLNLSDESLKVHRNRSSH